jgi:predicted nucleic acid-binding protein
VRFVLDASAAIKWYAAEPESEDALRLLQDGSAFVAPDILPLEVASVLLRKERRGELKAGTAGAALLDLDQVGCDLVPHGPLLKRATALATTHRLGVLDCLYLIVGRERGLPIMSYDAGMRRLAQHLSLPLWPSDDVA